MGLAPYGDPIYTDIIKEKLIDIRDDGSFKLNLKYFGYLNSLKMTNEFFNNLFSASPRDRESKLTKKDVDLAASIQNVIEEIILKPTIIGKSVDLHPILVIIGVIAGSNLFGFIGMLIAIPVLAIIKVMTVTLYKQLNQFQLFLLIHQFLQGAFLNPF